MKRLFVLLISAALMSSCIAVSGDEGANRVAKTFYVNSSDWGYGDNADGSNGYFYSEQTWSRLSASLMGDAVLVAYVKINGRYQQLPYIITQENLTDPNNPVYWQEKIDYDYATGSITFYVTYSDFYNQNLPVSMEFRAIMMW